MATPQTPAQTGPTNPVIAILASHCAYPWAFNQHPAGVHSRPFLDRLHADVLATLGMDLPDSVLAPLIETLPRVVKRRTNTGFVYEGVTLATREERARDDIEHGTRLHAELAHIEAAQRAHRERMHADGSPCGHGTPDSVTEAARAAGDAAVAAQRNQLDRLLEERHGPYLRMTVEDMAADASAVPARSPFLDAMLAAVDPEDGEGAVADQSAGDQW